MSMTYWLHTLDGRNMSDDSDDYSLLLQWVDELDLACQQLGVPLLSSFADSTDLEYCLAEDDDEESESESDPDPETGYGYGIDDQQWFAVADGLACLTALRQHVADGWKPDLDEGDRVWLLEDLDGCIARLQAMPAGGKFHLAVIM